jgi:hypothetical protein
VDWQAFRALAGPSLVARICGAALPGLDRPGGQRAERDYADITLPGGRFNSRPNRAGGGSPAATPPGSSIRFMGTQAPVRTFTNLMQDLALAGPLARAVTGPYWR